MVSMVSFCFRYSSSPMSASKFLGLVYNLQNTYNCKILVHKCNTTSKEFTQALGNCCNFLDDFIDIVVCKKVNYIG